MTILNFYYFLLFITVCEHFDTVKGAENLTLQEDVVTRNVLIDKFAWLQSCDRGCVAKPNINIETTRTMSLDDVTDLVHEAYVELQCSYVYFALAYLHLINTYISNPMTLVRPTEEELNAIAFVQESATIMTLLHTNLDQPWNTIKAVMWLFHTFVEKTSYFIVKHSSDCPDMETVNKSVIWPYNAISILLGEYTVAAGCKAYDPVTGRPANMSYVDKIRNVLDGDGQSVISKLSSNKNRFWAQTDRNALLGLVKSSHVFVGNLLMGMALDGGKVTIALENTFGVQLEWQSIRAMLKYYYYRARHQTIDASMLEYIQAIRMFQFQFVRLLKAIAMRIVIVYLLQLRHTVDNSVPPHFNDHNRRVAYSLNAFVKCVHLFGDEHLGKIIVSMIELSDNVETPKQIDKLVRDILELLTILSSPNDTFGVSLDVPMIDNVDIHNRSTYAAVEFARENGFNISEDTENVAVVEVYVEFVKRIAHFDVIYLFAELSTTEEFKRFLDLELEERLKQP